MQLDAVSDHDAMPWRGRRVVVGLRRRIGPDGQRRRQRCGNSPLEGIAGDVLHLLLDHLERRAFTLPDLDGQEL
jgi:hypothetical protein